MPFSTDNPTPPSSVGPAEGLLPIPPPHPRAAALVPLPVRPQPKDTGSCFLPLQHHSPICATLITHIGRHLDLGV